MVDEKEVVGDGKEVVGDGKEVMGEKNWTIDTQ